MTQPPAAPEPAEVAPGEGSLGEDAAEAGPLLGLLSRALEFWLRQQCETIEHLEIRLEGSAMQLLRGRLAGVRLEARQVRYEGLDLEEVRLRSDEIRVHMASLLRRQTLKLENPFRIQGRVCFSDEGLNRSLLGRRWSALGDSLAEELLGLTPLTGLRLEEDRLILQARAGDVAEVERAFRVRAEEGTVALSVAEGGPQMRLPMDEAIRIEVTEVGDGRLALSGTARVSAQ